MDAPAAPKSSTPPLRTNGEDAQLSGFATVDECAQFLHISRAMVHKLVKAEQIPAVRFGRCVRVPWTWLRTRASA